jgi:integrase
MLRQCSDRSPTGIRNKALIAVLWRSGLRISEVLALKPADFDLVNETVRVLHGKNDVSRTSSIDPETVALIQRWLDCRKDYGFRGAPAFCTITGSADGKLVPGAPLKGNYVRNLLNRLKVRAGVEKRVHPHGLRHSHAADLAIEGVPLYVIQQQLGHKHMSTTDAYLRNIAPGAVIGLGRRRPSWDVADEGPSS